MKAHVFIAKQWEECKGESAKGGGQWWRKKERKEEKGDVSEGVRRESKSVGMKWEKGVGEGWECEGESEGDGRESVEEYEERDRVWKWNNERKGRRVKKVKWGKEGRIQEMKEWKTEGRAKEWEKGTRINEWRERWGKGGSKILSIG